MKDFFPVDKTVTSKPQSVRRFYFFEYFYILLKSIQSYSSADKIFDDFLLLKHDFNLGESKYKKLTIDEDISPTRMGRYRYTFDQVLSEAIDYKLIKKRGRKSSEFFLTDLGEEALKKVKQDNLIEFNKYIFKWMEEKYHAFYYLINTCYKANPEKYGLLIFPIYSPSLLGIERKSIKSSREIVRYLERLQRKMEQDIELHLGKNLPLDKNNKEIVSKLINAGLISKDSSEPFNDANFNAIVKRVRDFWISYFLKELYGYQHSNTSFEIWAYRGKQVGVLQATEFYPNFNGKVVYPLSILSASAKSSDFKKLFTYPDDNRLYVHEPSWSSIKEKFIDSLFNAYFDVRESARSYFVNLLSVREIVCYSMKISEYSFDAFLGNAYKLSLNQTLKRIRISLEVDKLPEETSAIYLRRTPVMVDDRYRNIIAIDRIS